MMLGKVVFFSGHQNPIYLKEQFESRVMGHQKQLLGVDHGTLKEGY